MTNRVDCKVVLLGQEASGKTCLLERYIHNTFSGLPHSNTVGAAFSAKMVISNNKKVTLGIWDTAGAERFQAMARLYYRDAKAAIVCYDVTERKNFEKVRFWVNELHETEETCKVYLTGTKLDLVDDYVRARDVDFHDAREYSEDIGAVLIETSSKTGVNVKALFDKIADDFTSDPVNAAKLQSAPEDNVIDLKQKRRKHKNCCKS